jgi:hypothetical protein
MTNEQKKELEHLKRELSQPKRQLIDIYRKVEEISPAQARKLDKIIERLEAFQAA